MRQGNSQHETAIVIFLREYATKADQRLICAIACVCKEWSAAVERADTGTLSITYQPKVSPTTVGGSIREHKLNDSLVSLAMWLPKYAKLVSSIDINLEVLAHAPGADPEAVEQFTSVADTLLQLSLQAASCAERGLKLRSFGTDVNHGSKLWRALPGAHLTRLDAYHCGAGLAATLPRLKDLEVLSVWHGSAVCLPLLNQLSKLTSLILNGRVENLDARQLPVQLQQLEFSSRLSAMMGEPPQSNLAHLTLLTRLDISVDTCNTDSPPAQQHGLVFPEQLLQLSLRLPDGERRQDMSATRVFQLTRLCQLEQLELVNPLEPASELLKLAKLQRLQKLSLNVLDSWTSEKHQASSAWPQISQLQDLVVRPGCISFNQFLYVLDNIAACTGLTRLQFSPGLSADGMVAPVGMLVDLSQSISRLHKLQELELQLTKGATYWSGKAQYLKPLTRLTRLALDVHEDYIGYETACHELLSDAVLIASFLQLKQLLWLKIPVPSMGVLPVIGSITGLRHLEVSRLPSNAYEAEPSGTGLLSYLHALRNLSQLVGFEKCSDEALSQFWNALHS